MLRYDIQTGVKKIKTKTALAISGGALAATGLVMAVVIPLGAKAANATVTIDPSNFSTVFSNTDNRATSSNNFVFGPATPPAGSGSLELTTNDSLGKQQAFENQQTGSALSTVDSMGYSTYRHSNSTGSAVQVPSINMEIHTNATGTGTGYTTLVFEPVYNTTQGPIVNDTWQNWNAYDGGNAIWWSSHDIYDSSNNLIACNPNGDIANSPACAGKVFVPFSTIVSAFPAATVSDYGYNQGTGNPGIHANIDALSIGVSGNITTYDFEPATVTVTIDKFVDGAQATAAGTNNASFPMVSSWSATNIGTGSGSYSLGPVGFNNPTPYFATTSNMSLGANYSTNEVTTGNNVVSATCDGSAPYALVGYSTGSTLAEAIAAPTTTSSPAFTDLQNDQFVVVKNKTCPAVLAHPTNKDQCKNNGWQTLADVNNRAFKNQGDCVSYVATNHKNPANG